MQYVGKVIRYVRKRFGRKEMWYVGKRFSMSERGAVFWKEIQYVRNRCSMLERDLVCLE